MTADQAEDFFFQTSFPMGAISVFTSNVDCPLEPTKFFYAFLLLQKQIYQTKYCVFHARMSHVNLNFQETFEIFHCGPMKMQQPL